MWLPMLVFEVTLALWLLIKGVARRRPEHELDGRVAASQGQGRLTRHSQLSSAAFTSDALDP